MHKKDLNILQKPLNLLTSRFGIIMVVLLFVGTPIIGMSYSMVTSTSQLIEEEHSEEDSSEEESEDLFKILVINNRVKFIRTTHILKTVDLNFQIKNILPADIIIPPPEL